MLPRGFRGRTYLFGNTLAEELRELQLTETLLQYVADLLISNTNKEDSGKNSILVFNFLEDRGYKVSSKKSQMISQQGQFLRYLP